MTLEQRLDDLATRIAQELNAHRAEPHGGGGAAVEILQADVDTGQNANAVAATLTLSQGDVEGTLITLAGDTITVAFDGWVTISYGVVLSGAATRSVPELSVTRAGARVPGLTARHTYIRNSSGHTESSANAATDVKVADGDQFTLTCRRMAGTVTVTTQAESRISVRRIA